MSNPAARTADGPMAIVAVDQFDEHPLIRDPLAHRFLTGGARWFAAANRLAPVRRWTIRSMEKRIPGLWANMLCRKRYVDDRLAESAESGIDAVVVLGAGFDDRAYRLPALEATPVFEVDLPENIDRKRAVLRRAYGGAVPGSATLVPLDFATGDLAGALAAHGYRKRWRTFFVWEAVTQYLDEEAVRATFDVLAEATAGSRLVFTYVHRDLIDGTNLFGAEAAYNKWVVREGLWRFGMRPEEVAGFLAGYGWREVEQAGAREFAARYVAPTGRALGTTDAERSVYAEKV
ncbi:SAM-dependent methyltransferase [Streptomonospora sp. PA3]|uniref:SAM-dependent methyltransferase n=1 Tax=Streptomonospora sp. PA3 TaxID=2607326 RepID=UPI0012DFC9E7|nr:SAM-dependent methyltransferase [Streptomonospora sp. PA3]MUL41948.1 SAM-dependent methyltransferase [Streptomonospora sp. PA3]